MQVVVIGGGAAGFFAAITCAETHPHCRVTIIEKSRHLLAKVRISGGGRCNVTHACYDPAELVRHYPRGGAALRGPFSRFQPADTIAWFNQRGVALKTEADGRIFPTSDNSATIVNCLEQQARQAGVTIHTETAVTQIEYLNPGFRLTQRDGAPLHADRLLLATGSNRQGYRWAEALGHTIAPPVPSLFTFTLDDPRLAGLAGVSVPAARLQLPHLNLEQSGPLLITHWGLSGPVVLKLSAWGARPLFNANYQTPLRINWLPQYNQEELRQALQATKNSHGRRLVAGGPTFDLPQRLWARLVTAVGIAGNQRWADLSRAHLNRLIAQLLQGEFQIQGKGVFKEEFVTCGGVYLDEVNFKTMASRRCPGLYFAGEILDIDALTGGFNFQAAWTTGWLAGQAMGAEVQR